MALEAIQEKYIPRDNSFYCNYYHYFLYGLMIIIFLMMIAVGVVFYQMLHRPLPVFYAIQPDGSKMTLTSYEEPNLLPDTLLRWASKAATTAYTFDFVNYDKEIGQARPYFTAGGWKDFLASLSNVITTIVKNKLIVSGIVSGAPVIANQGPLPGRGYVWRVQIPFLVTYQSANTTSKRRFYVVMTIVRVPTEINPQGIGIDQFVMV